MNRLRHHLRSMIRVLTTVICAAVLVGLAACGGDGDDTTSTGAGTSARAAAQSYVDASNARDAATICRLYSEKLINQLAASDCEDFVAEQTSGASTKLELGSVHQSGDQATVTLQSSGETGQPVPLQIQLQEENGEWKVSSLGPGGGA